MRWPDGTTRAQECAWGSSLTLLSVDVQTAVQTPVHPLWEAALGLETAAQHHDGVIVCLHRCAILQQAVGAAGSVGVPILARPACRVLRPEPEVAPVGWHSTLHAPVLRPGPELGSSKLEQGCRLCSAVCAKGLWGTCMEAPHQLQGARIPEADRKL